MRQPLKIVIAVLLAAVCALAIGCGSDDDSSSGGDAADKTTTSAQAAADDDTKAEDDAEDEPEADAETGGAKPKPAGARAKMLSCLEEAGFEISHEGDDEQKATDYTIEGTSGRKKRAEIVIHSNQNDAAGAATKAGEEKGLNAVAFGRAEFIRYEATDTEAGQIVNCVAAGYTR